MHSDHSGRRKPPFFCSRLPAAVIFGTALLMAHSSAAHAAPGMTSYAEVEAFSYSQAVPVEAAFNDWRGRFYGGTVAMLYSKAEAGVTGEHWRFGLLSRLDYQLQFSPDAAEFYHRISNQQNLDIGRGYVIDITGKHFFGSGFRLGYHHSPLPGLTLEFGLSYLEGQRLIDGTLNGRARSVAPNDYRFDLMANYYYSRDVLFQRQVDTPSGQGYSTDLRLAWRPDGPLRVQLTVTDLIARIRWQEAPYTQASGTSAAREYDEQGYVRFRPLLSGIEGNQGYTQKLPTRASLGAQYSLTRRISALANLFYTEPRTFSSVGLAWQPASGVEWQGIYNTTTQSYTLRAGTRQWRVGATADTFDFKQARALGAELQFNQLF